nr:hypothetical protein GCM10025730_25300 [Promicromonospora thailandica]
MTAEEAAAEEVPAVERLYSGWGQQVRWWDAAFGVIVGLTAVALVLEGTRGVRLTVAFAAMGAIVVAYVLWGRGRRGPATSGRPWRTWWCWCSVRR